MTVLVLSEELDPTADALIDVLRSRNVPVVRVDTGWFPLRLALDAEVDQSGWAGRLCTGDREVSLVGLRSIWYRSPTAFQFPDSMSAPERLHATYEAKFGLGGVLASLPVLWVNHPGRQADLYKPTQLAVASRSGLPVPRTMVTNRADAVRRFVASVQGSVVVKPLGAASIVEQGVRKPLYTHLLTEANLDDLSGVESTAHLFQQYIDKAYDVRLTVVGGRLFAAAIQAGSNAARVDFRSDYDALTYHIVDTPPQVVAGVRAFMDHFGLAFGAFDFAVDADGCWWMLECNPGGQFAWIEQETGLPITVALADLLQKGAP